MRIKDGFLLRTIAGTNIVVPIAETVIDFKGMMILNDVSAKIWKFIEVDREYGEIVDFMLSTYEVDYETVKNDIDILLKKMEDNGVLVQ